MSSAITNSKLCNYGCSTQIYWNTNKKACYEVETGNKHYCVSRKSNTTTNQSNNSNIRQGTNTRPTYYNARTGKPLTQSQQSTKQQLKHSNSIQILKGTEQEIQKQYETLADILAEVNGMINGSESLHAHYSNSSQQQDQGWRWLLHGNFNQ